MHKILRLSSTDLMVMQAALSQWGRTLSGEKRNAVSALEEAILAYMAALGDETAWNHELQPLLPLPQPITAIDFHR